MSKILKIHLVLMGFTSTTNMAGYIITINNQLVDWLVRFALCVEWQHCYIYFWYLSFNGKTLFRSQKDLRSIQLCPLQALQIYIVIHYLKSVWTLTDDGCLVTFNQRIVISSFNILLLVNGKTGFRCKQCSNSFTYELHQHYKYGWKHIFITQNQLVEWLVKFDACFQANIAIFTFNILLVNGKTFLRSENDLSFILLWCLIALQKWLETFFEYQKSTCVLTGDVCFMFLSKSLLY